MVNRMIDDVAKGGIVGRTYKGRLYDSSLGKEYDAFYTVNDLSPVKKPENNWNTARILLGIETSKGKFKISLLKHCLDERVEK